MTNDGGCAESLNVQLDNTELAPMLYPTDVTTKLGLPENLEAKRIFIHKTANYENYIVVQSDRVVAYTPDIVDNEPLPVFDLKDGEEVNDITPVGNTLIIATSNDMYYVIFKERTYNFLGNTVPMPKIDFYAERKEVGWKAEGNIDFLLYFFITAEGWNKSDKKQLIEATEKVWKEDPKSLKKIISECLNNHTKAFVSPRFIQYSVELNAGSPLVSLPILVGAGSLYKPTVHAKCIYSSHYDQEEETEVVETINTSEIKFNGYSIKARLTNLTDLSDWKDIITNIKIYISDDLYLISDYKSKKLECVSFEVFNDSYNDRMEYEAEFSLAPTMPDIDSMLGMGSLTYLSQTIPVSKYMAFTPEIQELVEGIDIEASPDYAPEKLNENMRLSVGDMKNYPIVPAALGVYNNRLLAINNASTLTYNHHGLGATINSSNAQTKYEVYFVTKRTTKNLCFKADIEAATPQYGDLIFCPDEMCSRVIIRATRDGKTRYINLAAKPHPGLSCSYASFHDTIYDIEELYGQMSVSPVNAPLVSPIDEKQNSLFVSPVNEPFVFPAEGRFTFQSKILGVAVATTTLSQGQFGQFPLYVFTEDGIWAMETGADGSFISQKPLTRDVCVNPDSITSLDNAVVFVSAQGVMLLQGSQVTNISPYMNGRHYQIEDSAEILMAAQKDFKGFISIVDDETHFLAFVKEAKIAYDYAGKRLIFINEGEDYQYIYKLDTQTWHKAVYGIKLKYPINSYPECLIMGEGESLYSGKKVLDFSTALDAAVEKTPTKGVIVTRALNLDEPDVFKTITDIRVRGQFKKGAVKFILLGSNDGDKYHVISTLRGKAWKLFRIILLTDLQPTDRISWIDVQYETKFTNRLR